MQGIPTGYAVPAEHKEPAKPQPPIRNTNTSSSKDLSKDEKWQSFRKIFRSAFGMPDANGKPMGEITTTDVLNSMEVMEKQ